MRPLLRQGGAPSWPQSSTAALLPAQQRWPAHLRQSVQQPDDAWLLGGLQSGCLPCTVVCLAGPCPQVKCAVEGSLDGHQAAVRASGDCHLCTDRRVTLVQRLCEQQWGADALLALGSRRGWPLSAPRQSCHCPGPEGARTQPAGRGYSARLRTGLPAPPLGARACLPTCRRGRRQQLSPRMSALPALWGPTAGDSCARHSCMLCKAWSVSRAVPKTA